MFEIVSIESLISCVYKYTVCRKGLLYKNFRTSLGLCAIPVATLKTFICTSNFCLSTRQAKIAFRKQKVHLCCASLNAFKGINNSWTEGVETKAQYLSLPKDHLWDSKQQILQDIKETKAIVKEKVDEIIERENIWTVPNMLCVSRILLSPILCGTIGYAHYSISLWLFVLAGFTDLIDGAIARALPSQASRLGSFLDPLADKVLISSLFLSLTYVGLIPLTLTVLIIYRDIVMIVAASYIRYKSLPPPVTLQRYFDASHATAQLSPTLISKFNTATQLSFITASLAAPVFGFIDHHLLHLFGWFTAGTTLASGISYIFSKDTYKMLSKNNSKS